MKNKKPYLLLPVLLLFQYVHSQVIVTKDLDTLVLTKQQVNKIIKVGAFAYKDSVIRYDTIIQSIKKYIPPGTANKPPVANAGVDFTITLPASQFQLNGSLSNDPDGTIKSYGWRKIGGPTATITDTNKSIALVSNFIAGVYSFELRVVDNLNAFKADTVKVTVNNPPVNPPGNLGGYFASPNGTGNGTASSPFRISNFWSVAKPGDTLNLMDGRYTGAASMITPPQNLSGTATQRIVIRAINDGKVEIDGQSLNPTFELENNNYFTIEGINVHHPGHPTNWSVSVVSLNYSSHNILRRICAWEARDGNTNIFGIHNGTNNLLEDCAGWGTARKTFSNSQQGNFTTFRRCFARWEGSHAQGPKHGFALSYNSYNALAENCIGTWDGIKMKENYELLDYYNNGIGQFFNNYTVQQPNGIFSHDGFDVQPDIANVRIYGCIAYVKANQRFHNSTKTMATTYTYEIKGVDIKNSLAYIEPGSRTNIPVIYLSGGTTANNKASGLTLIGGGNPNLSSGYSPVNIIRSTTCGTINTRSLITKRTVNGVETNEDLWPWPMNQRIMDAMVMGGYAPYDVTKEVFGLCSSPPPSADAIIQKAKQWLSAAPAQRTALEPELAAWTSNIDEIISKVKPQYTKTTTGKILNNPLSKYPGHQYHIYVPLHYKPSTPIGLLLWMHGGGSPSDNDLQHLADFEMDDETVTGRSYPRTETDKSNYILVAPVAPFGSFIPHPEHASRWNVPGSDQYLMDVITDVASQYNIDFNRVVVSGFSMGGIGAFHHALRLNDRVAAVMASAGSWDIGSWKSLSAPLYIIHGVKDAYFNSTSDCRSHFTPIEYARLAKQVMAGNCELKEYPGGHSWDGTGQASWKAFINGMSGWVTDKVRNPYRSNVTAINPWRSYNVGSNFGISWTENPSPHTMWVTIKEMGSGSIAYDQANESGNGGCSSLADFNNWSLSLTTTSLKGGKTEARITGPNQISITTENVTKMSIWLHPSMVDMSQPVLISLNGSAPKAYTCNPSLLKALQSYERRWDWSMIYHAEIDIN